MFDFGRRLTLLGRTLLVSLTFIIGLCFLNDTPGQATGGAHSSGTCVPVFTNAGTSPTTCPEAESTPLGQVNAQRVDTEFADTIRAAELTWRMRPINWKNEEREHRAILALVADNKVQSGADYASVAKIIEQHITPDAKLQAHVFALDSLALGDRTARWMAAETLDSFLTSIGSEQLFGTHYAFVDSSKPRERGRVASSLVTDHLRTLLCVARLEGNHKSPLTLRTGLSNDSLRVRSCPYPLRGRPSPLAALLYAEDQADRSNAGLSAQEIERRDFARRARAERLIKDGHLKAAADFYHLAMIYQHGQNPASYLGAHVLSMIALAYGSDEARWLSAATLDRYLRSVWRPQIFGTQFSQAPWEDGFSLEPMNTALVSDPARVTLCVPAVAKERKNDERSKNDRLRGTCPD